MSRFYSYLNSANHLIDLYKGELPFAIFLKQYFAKEKKYGSKDRKNISALCFNYFRIANALKNCNEEERLVIGIYICENKPNPILALLQPAWNETIHESVDFKINLLKDKIDVDTIFPLLQHVANGIDKALFTISICIQPNLFIRLRPEKESLVTESLKAADLAFESLYSSTLALVNGSKLPDSLVLDQDYVVQDASSQQVGTVLKTYLKTLTPSATVWDCCAASGGKSIMMKDAGFDYQLYVSDIRASILANLTQRFSAAGIKNYTQFIADLTSPTIKAPLDYFDLILADVPCSGSGTWGRTPEQLSFFKAEDIQLYTNRQNLIVANLSSFLKKNGLLVYITCSVFKEENEEIVKNIVQLGFDALHTQYILGYKHKADSMFLSILQKK